MKVLLKADGRAAVGGSSTLMVHSERLADPLDLFVRSINTIAKKRNKTEADHLEKSRQEFYGCLYTDPIILGPDDLDGQQVVMPQWNILGCLKGGASQQKRGKDVARGIFPLVEFAPISFEGPTDIIERWQQGYWIRKTVGVQRARVPRTRPIFTEWTFELPVEVDSKIWDLDKLASAWKEAGTYVGLCEMRPTFGRFAGTIEVVEMTVQEKKKEKGKKKEEE